MCVQVYKARMDAMKANPDMRLPNDWVRTRFTSTSSRPLLSSPFSRRGGGGCTIATLQKQPPPAKPHKAKLLVKLKAGVTRDQREFVINGLKNFIKHNRVLVSDTAELVGATVLATQLLMLFFYVGMGATLILLRGFSSWFADRYTARCWLQ
jgi:hypothetical protein